MYSDQELIKWSFLSSSFIFDFFSIHLYRTYRYILLSLKIAKEISLLDDLSLSTNVEIKSCKSLGAAGQNENELILMCFPWFSWYWMVFIIINNNFNWDGSFTDSDESVHMDRLYVLFILDLNDFVGTIWTSSHVCIFSSVSCVSA